MISKNQPLRYLEMDATLPNTSKIRSQTSAKMSTQHCDFRNGQGEQETESGNILWGG